MTTYDLLGKVVGHTDELGRVTAMSYDLSGRLIRTDYPGGTSESYAYDAEGRLVGHTDRGGRTTTFAYDATGRLVSTTFPDGPRTSNLYDDAGQLVATTDARGNTTVFEYDAAGHQTAAIDPLGNDTKFTYDDNGNQVAVTDARGQTTGFVYDELNRLTTTLFPDGTTTQIGYDNLGRRVTEIDEAGRATTFGYDALDRLVYVTDRLGQATTYGYDEVGNRVSQTDANGHTTTFEYDALGRKTARTLPAVGDPSLTVTERWAYDAVGNLVSKTKFDGATLTFTYDAMDRLTKKSLPDGSEVTFTYTATGRRASVNDGRGTTTYSYDARDRLVALVYPDGRALLYEYDAEGNRVALTAQINQESLTTSSTYDPLNRLATVTDPDGRSYVHRYDPNGNRISIVFPNGLTTTNQYDVRNRLAQLTTSGSAGVIQSYDYTLGPMGNRTRILEGDGRTYSYSYDDLLRLAGERVTGAAETLVYDETFNYDAVSNRLEQNQTASDGSITPIVYAYDERARLLSRDGVAHSWDVNGNLIAESGALGATYIWDVEDRLVGVQSPDGTTVEHAYDTDGVRVKTTVTPPGGPTEISAFLVDTSRALSQVVAETAASGALADYYVRGDVLLATLRPSGVRFYHADGLGSIRRLTDAAGLVTDSYVFSAFGEHLEHQGDDPNDYLFAGERFDVDSELYYLRARWLNTTEGRFVSSDLFEGRLTNPASQHPYVYALQNPVMLSDPSGQFVGILSVGLVALAIAVVIATNLPPIDTAIPIKSVPAFDVSYRGRLFILGWEAWRPNLYNDAANHCTIGFGSLVHEGRCAFAATNAAERPYLGGITLTQGFQLFGQNLRDRALTPVHNLINVPLNQFELDAVVSLVYNIGAGDRFRDSNTRTLINQGRTRRSLNEARLRREWGEFRLARGRVLQGLVDRRAGELEIFFNGAYNIRYRELPRFPE